MALDRATWDAPVEVAPLRGLKRSPYAPSTWVMDVPNEAATLPPPPSPKSETTTAPMGFWNNMPLDEVREPLPVLPPSYGPEKRLRFKGVNVGEMAMLIAFTYLFLALAHLVIMIAGSEFNGN